MVIHLLCVGKVIIRNMVGKKGIFDDNFFLLLIKKIK